MKFVFVCITITFSLIAFCQNKVIIKGNNNGKIYQKTYKKTIIDAQPTFTETDGIKMMRFIDSVYKSRGYYKKCFAIQITANSNGAAVSSHIIDYMQNRGFEYLGLGTIFNTENFKGIGIIVNPRDSCIVFSIGILNPH